MPTKNTKQRNYAMAVEQIWTKPGWQRFTDFHWRKDYGALGRIDYWPSTDKMRHTDADGEGKTFMGARAKILILEQGAEHAILEKWEER